MNRTHFEGYISPEISKKSILLHNYFHIWKILRGPNAGSTSPSEAPAIIQVFE